ncbi:transposase, MuDR, MULE transposase domain protein [Tanacetum coccineum]
MENIQSRNPNITNSTSSDMENTHSVFDAKVTIRGTLHTLASIKELLGQSVNERRKNQHEVKQEQNNDVCPPIRYKIGNNNFEFDPLKKVRVLDLLELIRKPKMWYALSDENSVKVCLLLVSNIVFIGRESKNYIADNLIELVDDLSAWDAYPWGEYFWRALYRRYILEMYRNNKFWWKKDPLVIPRGLAWSKIGNFEKGDYGALFAEWSNPILCMAPTSTELLQPWLIRSMDYFRTLLVDGQPNGPITASPEGIQPIICAAVVHDPQFEQQPKEVVESVPLFTSEELVAEYHSITTTVQLIENVGDGDPSIVLKELAAVKQRMNAIERFIKSRNDNLSEDSVAKQSVEKEIESSDGKADSAISNVLIGEISCQNLVQEQLQSRDMCIQSITNQIVQHPLESPKGKRTESSISDVFHGELSVVETSKNEALSEEFDPKEYDKNVDDSGVGKASESEIINVLTGQVSCDKYVGGFYECESSKLYYTDPKEYPSSSQMLAYTPVDLNLPNLNQSFTESQVNEYAEFDFDNPENDSLSVMVKTGEEEIHLDGLETVDDPFVQTPDKQNSKEMSMYVNEALVEPYTVQPPTTAPSAFLKVDRKRLKRKARLNLSGFKGWWLLSDRHLEAWFELMWRFRPKDADWAIASSYLCGFVMRGDIPGWVCNEVTYPVMWADVEQVFFSINEANKHYCLGVLHIRTGVITLYDSLFSEAVETRKWWIKMRKAFKKYIPPYLQEWGILDAKGIPLESYNITFVVGKDVPIQGDAYGDCGVWVCKFLYHLIHKMAMSAKDPQIVGLAYREHMFDYFWKYKIAN